MANRGLPVTPARLLHAVWGAQYVGQAEYPRSFIRPLRRKLGDDAPTRGIFSPRATLVAASPIPTNGPRAAGFNSSV